MYSPSFCLNYVFSILIKISFGYMYDVPKS
nr:MAG TPA: hypothetical protein [Caudoviricetes sp.]